MVTEPHLPLSDEQHEHVATVVETALGPKFDDDAKKKIDDILYNMQADIEYDLEGRLSLQIAGVAQRRAEQFIAAVMHGNEDAIQQFIGNPPGYQNWQRDFARHSYFRRGAYEWTDPVKMRRAMIETCGNELVTEVIADQTTQIAALEAIVAELRTKITCLQSEELKA